ncbi:hypothetical protein [Halohasta salina]|uniref:hypothetical protein n=1 Tax=Halohasta salina TaxID=2961621 RepID=UPI0020A4396A|nr:hypothetical protein [Halohasta salina]
MTDGDSLPLDRRTVLASVGSVGAASLAGCTVFSSGEDAGTTDLTDDRARDLAEQFAPTLYFDEAEQWFPTDPRSYESQQDGETVVDGFDAFDAYTAAARDTEEPPEPTVFFHAVAYDESPLAVIQFWYYSAFDQFTTNFHWHDWEVLHVFVDTDSGEPQLYVASSHSGRVPNNEFLDPNPDQQPRILSELGSHSSALSINEIADRFQRLSVEGILADITNSAIETLEDVANIPIAYGLPRDEGSRLPYVVPELDGGPIYEHDRLPSVDREALITDDLTVRSFSDLTSPPGDLPARSTGLVFGHGPASDDDTEVDVEYDLVPSSELEHITAFSGPQLSFEFAVPEFAEDAIAGHITTAKVPWNQPRYTEPAADITDANHRGTLADRYDAIGEPASVNSVIASVSEAITNDDAPDGEGLTTGTLSTEALALLESDPEAVPTFNGLAVMQGVPAGEHRLTINAAGVEPHSETLAVADDTEPTAAGVDGRISLVARENATKLEVDASGSDSEITNLAVEDDFAGRLYDAPLSGQDAVYVHRGGAYTTEVRDSDDEIGAERVNPTDNEGVRIENPSTGKGSLAGYLADVADETSAAVAAVDEEGDSDDDDDDNDDDSNRNSGTGGGSENAVQGLARALEAISEAARRAAERAAAGDREQADRSLANVQDRLDRAATRLAEAGGDLPDELQAATERRLDQSRRRSEQARAAEKL